MIDGELYSFTVSFVPKSEIIDILPYKLPKNNIFRAMSRGDGVLIAILPWEFTKSVTLPWIYSSIGEAVRFHRTYVWKLSYFQVMSTFFGEKLSIHRNICDRSYWSDFYRRKWR